MELPTRIMGTTRDEAEKASEVIPQVIALVSHFDDLVRLNVKINNSEGATDAADIIIMLLSELYNAGFNTGKFPETKALDHYQDLVSGIMEEVGPSMSPSFEVIAKVKR